MTNKKSDGIQETEVEDTSAAEALKPTLNPELPAGVPEGTVEKSEHSDENIRDRVDFEEKVVHDVDEDGNVVGWHKVPADGSTPKEQKGVLTEEQSKVAEEPQDKEDK